MPRNLFVDTACFAFPERGKDAPAWQPHCARIAVALVDEAGKDIGGFVHLVSPEPNWRRTDLAYDYHRATAEDFRLSGATAKTLALLTGTLLGDADVIVGHNIGFHLKMLGALFADGGDEKGADLLALKAKFCTMAESADICQIRLLSAGRWKPPALHEAYGYFTGFTGVRPISSLAWRPFAEGQLSALRAVYRGIQNRTE